MDALRPILIFSYTSKTQSFFKTGQACCRRVKRLSHHILVRCSQTYSVFFKKDNTCFPDAC